MMKGILWKWTNYWNGWQPRWFILEDGLLSYYKSEEEVKQGCKGSLSLSACDITVHPTDNSRIEICIPGEQHLYVRASSTLERQQWLVALGTAKAHGPESKARKTSDSSMNQDIKTKKSELRLYGDLLMQQVLSIKEAAIGETGVPDTQKLDECTSLFSATCDTFIKTLEECVKLSNSMALNVQATSTQLPPVVPHINGSSSKSDRTRTHSHSSVPE